MLETPDPPSKAFYPPISIVAALDDNRVIGANGGIPWHLPDDLRFFKRVTLDKPLIMGRKTYESIGRPLPRRQNIILTRRADFEAVGCQIVHSREAALDLTREAPEIMVAGGAEIYAMFLPLAYRLYLTHVETKVAGDTFFPDYDPANWREILRQSHEIDKNHPFRFHIAMYERVFVSG